jgi:uncharacterized protein VirK/YbjX
MAHARLQWTDVIAPPAELCGRFEGLKRLMQAATYVRAGTRPIGPARIAAHFLRCAAHLDTFRDWFGNPRHGALQEALLRRPTLVNCVVHPYLNAGWSAERKLEVIAGHYAILDGRLGFLRFAATEVVALGQAPQGLHIRLDKPASYEHEGEVNISLFSAETRLYSLVFTLSQQGIQRVAYIGALQGMHSADALEIYRGLTHHMFGLRPRDLLVDAFRMLCVALGVTRILAVSDAARVSRNAYFSSSTQVYSSYDSAWIDAHALAVEENFFELNPARVERAIEDIPSRKRAQYRRRYAMLDDLCGQIAQSVQAASKADMRQREGN